MLIKASGNESKFHIKLKRIAAYKLLEEGFSVGEIEFEKPLKTKSGRFIVDVYAKDSKREVIIECGKTGPRKIWALEEEYSDVRVFGYHLLKPVPDVVLSWSCDKCYMVIESFYKKQFDHNRKAHKKSHSKKVKS